MTKSKRRKRNLGGRSFMQLATLLRGGSGAGRHDPRPKRQRTRSSARRAAMRDDE